MIGPDEEDSTIQLDARTPSLDGWLIVIGAALLASAAMWTAVV